MRRWLLAVPLLMAQAPASAPSGPDAWLPRGSAELVVLDKMRAQPTSVSVKAGQQAGFATLTIAVQRCMTRPPDVAQNNAAFVEVTDSRNSAPVFRGWLLSHTPSVSMFEHPVYDIKLATCR